MECQDGHVTTSRQPPRSYGGVDGDERVARRRAALIDAALTSLGGEGGGSITVRGVCAEAALTPRYFYESFASVDDLVAATFDGVVAEIAERGGEAFAAGDDFTDKVTRAVAAIVDVVADDRRKGRLMFGDHLTSPVVAARRAASIGVFAELTLRSAEGLGRWPVLTGAPGLAAAHFQVGGFGRVLASWLDGALDLDRDALIGVCVKLLLVRRDW